MSTKVSVESLIKKYGLRDTTWTYKGLHASFHMFFAVTNAIFRMKSFFKDGPRTTIFFIKDDFQDWYWGDTDLTRIREKFFIRLKRNPNYLEQLKKMWRKRMGEFDKVLATLHATDLKTLSNEELKAIYKNYFNAYADQFCVFMTIGDAISMHAERYLVPEFEQVLGKDFKNVFPQLVSTEYKSFVDQEAEDRRKLVQQYKRHGRVSEKALRIHADRYFYIHNNYSHGVYLTPAYFLKHIKADSKKKSETKKTHLATPQQRARLMKLYNLSAWQRTLLYVMSEFFGIQDTRKKYVMISSYYQMRFLKEASRRTGVSMELLRQSIVYEYDAIIDGTFDRAELRRRQQGSVCIQTPDDRYIGTGDIYKKLKPLFTTVDPSITELSGMVASPGTAEGRVCIVQKREDIKKMKQGNILISSMTRPEMVPAMKKAAAIVTDEGGITSHAAIISRELGIPCVLATKHATKIFKNGDRVSVDAHKGVVTLKK